MQPLKAGISRAVSTLPLAFATLFAASCGAPQSPPPTAQPPAASASAARSPAPSPGAVAWKDMNREQRLDYMKKVVYPKMKDEFINYDAKRYADMTCLTCHGDGAK